MPINFEKLMARNPTEYGRMVNSKGQEIVFLEHPIMGDEAEVIVASLELKKADYSGFFDTDDMEADHLEYEPWFDDDGRLNIGELGPN
jgi:hypothetical protein